MPFKKQAAQPVDVQLGERYNVAWRAGGRMVGEILERRPLKQYRDSNSGTSSATDLGPGDYEYYVHFPKHDKRLDEWVGYDKIDVGKGPVNDGQEDKLKRAALKRSRSDGDLTAFSLGSAEDAKTREEKSNMIVSLEKEGEELTKVKNLNKISLGRYEMETWYYSPFPEAYCGKDVLYICEFCLSYCKTKKSLVKHMAIQCNSRRQPPGKLIYDEKTVQPAVAMYEIDGAGPDKTYCQNLCLLSKLFLDHKTLYYDVDPFLFYVLCEVDTDGAHIVGYFSKEKQSQEGYNLACILTFPSYQRQGYGKLLISISYEITRRESTTGSPEKPLSDLGKISYRSYWTFVILKIFEKSEAEKKNITVHDITKQTGIKYEDITSTLHSLNLIKAWKGQHVVSIAPDYIEKQRKQTKQIRLCNPSCLTWSPPPKLADHNSRK